MKCLNCGTVFKNPRWPAAWRSRLAIYKRTGQINGHRPFGAFTCSVRCHHIIAGIRAVIYRAAKGAK